MTTTTKMMPGHEPYTPAKLAQLSSMVADAAAGDPDEANEPTGLTPAERLILDRLSDAVRQATATAVRSLLAGRPTA